MDKFDRRKLLFITQTVSLLCALSLGILTITGQINLIGLLIITLVSGIANALDNPASQAFVTDIVKKEDLASAIGLNSTMFNAGRVLGPAAAGFLIALVGMGNIFLINAASFLAILISLYFIKSTSSVQSSQDNPVQAIKEGLAYSFTHPLISVLLVTAGVGAVFCFSQATIMPVLAEQVFSNGTQGLGILLSSFGLGALIASFIISSQFKKVRSIRLIASGFITFLIGTLAFSYTTNIYVGSVFLFFSGLGLTLQFSSIYATIQKLTKEEFRGRVSSIYVLLFVGFAPLGNLFIGSTTSMMGPQNAIRLCLLVLFAYGMLMYFNLSKVKRRYRQYINSKPQLQPAPAYSYVKD